MIGKIIKLIAQWVLLAIIGTILGWATEIIVLEVWQWLYKN